MHAEFALWHGQNILQPGLHVVRVEDCLLSHLAHPSGTERAQVERPSQQNPDVAEEAAHAADRLLRGDQRVAYAGRRFGLLNHWPRQVVAEEVPDRDGPRSRSPSSVRAGECLMHVVVHHVATKVAGPRHTDDGVHVRPVDVDQTADIVQHLRDRRDLLLEQAQRIWIGHHEHSCRFIQLLLELIEIDKPGICRWQLDTVEPGERCTGRVGPVSTTREQHLRPLLAPISEVRSCGQQRGELALRPSCGLQ